MEQALDQRLMLVSAPAGYGKTTLISQWLAASDRSAAWVSLDRGDNNPARFWSYISAAVQRFLAAPGLALPDGLLLPAWSEEALISELINTMDGVGRPLILVLDDYHNIEAQPIHDGVSFLLEHAPPQLHLVITTRRPAPVPGPAAGAFPDG